MPNVTNSDESTIEKIEDAVEVAAADVVKWFRHVETGVVGFFRSAGLNTDGDHVTTIIDAAGEPFSAPTPSFGGIADPSEAASAKGKKAKASA